MKELTIKDLIEELQEYPEDTPIWPQLHNNRIMIMLDLEHTQYHSLDGGQNYELHLIFKVSEIYNEIDKMRKKEE